jgi:hypothetical protein
VALVAAIVVTAVAVGRPGDGPRPSAPIGSAPAPAPTPTPTPKPGVESPNQDCGHGDGLVDVFTTEPPPIDADSLSKQQAVIDRIKSRDWPGFRIVGTEATQLGVVALVDDHYQEAKRALEAEGVRMVALEARELGSVHDEAMNFIQELLEPAIDDINRARKDVPGYYGIAVWSEGGAVVLNWKAPIPDEIQALAGVREDGVNVIVQPVRYSLQEITAAQQRVSDALEHQRVDAQWSSSTGCQDGSGLVVGIQPDSLGSRKDALESQLSEIAGLPVHVVAEEPPVPL